MFIKSVDKYLAELHFIERHIEREYSYFATENNPEELSIIHANIVHLLRDCLSA